MELRKSQAPINKSQIISNIEIPKIPLALFRKGGNTF
jgi:hypothetical protein